MRRASDTKVKDQSQKTKGTQEAEIMPGAEEAVISIARERRGDALSSIKDGGSNKQDREELLTFYNMTKQKAKTQKSFDREAQE